MFNFTELSVEGLKVKVELGVSKDTQNNTSFWQIHGASVIDFKDLRVHTDSLVFNTALEIFHQVLLMYLKAEEHGYGSAVKKGIEKFNLLLRSHSSILIPFATDKHHYFNTTVSYAPEIDADT